LSIPSPLLRPPPTSSRPATTSRSSRLIGNPASQADPGAEEDLSSSLANPLTIPCPLRREVPRHPLQDQECRPWPSPNDSRLGSSFPRPKAGHITTPQASLQGTDWPVARPALQDFVAPLRRRPLDRRREPCCQGPWRLPGPNSHRLADENLRSDHPIIPYGTSFTSGRPNSWTHSHTRARSGPELLEVRHLPPQ
jgi:hypothetical protein